MKVLTVICLFALLAQSAAVEFDEDETEVISRYNPYMEHAKQFRKDFEKSFAKRPAGTPNAKDFFEQIKQKFQVARQNMENLKPTDKSLTDADKLNFQQAYQRLVKYQHEAMDKVKDWAREG
ncbi:uncharacterized protein [Watersipora subatra]|uniref:uncharacterized protein n=1 Tax=Watersipora subatra TaxID=2589382 RepID=UPI00355B0C4B